MTRLAITASGLITCGGFSTAASLAAIRAGLRTVQVTWVWDAESGTFLPAGKVELPQWSPGLDTLADLAAAAILQCIEAAHPLRGRDLPVLLGIASPDRPHRLQGLETQLLPEVEHRLGFRLHPASRLIARGHAAIAVGIYQAHELLNAQQVPGVVVAGVDSLLGKQLTDHYLQERRLLTPFNSNGFTVGEAGSAVLVVPADSAGSGALHVLGMGMAREEATITSDKPLRAEGLTRAIRGALKEANLTIQEVDYRIADLNGEHYKFKEMALAMGRFPRKPTPRQLELWHPIEYIGDIGAAIGPAIAAVAVDAACNDYAVGPTVLCTFSNDGGERAALVLRRPGA
jgi:3-oxoacyl-[acyl-carrier-protein] synthase-1